MKNFILIILLTSILVSCTSEDEKMKNEEERLKELKNIETNKIIDSLVYKYNISYNWDTLRFRKYRYTSDFKPIINSNCQLITKIYVDDIYEIDGIQFVSISNERFSFSFPISMEQEIKLREEKSNIIMVIRISNIKKIVDEDSSNDFIGSGEIIDIVALKKWNNQ
ncbi:MAG: hypothetical protein LW852_02980 [Sediminibacterium sp.]|jgi:hypothetical protein|nr:hypothetical protein [Sediminibacterium sp.]